MWDESVCRLQCLKSFPRNFHLCFHIDCSDLDVIAKSYRQIFSLAFSASVIPNDGAGLDNVAKAKWCKDIIVGQGRSSSRDKIKQIVCEEKRSRRNALKLEKDSH